MLRTRRNGRTAERRLFTAAGNDLEIVDSKSALLEQRGQFRFGKRITVQLLSINCRTRENHLAVRLGERKRLLKFLSNETAEFLPLIVRKFRLDPRGSGANAVDRQRGSVRRQQARP